jgi:hypothetical protein
MELANKNSSVKDGKTKVPKLIPHAHTRGRGVYRWERRGERAHYIHTHEGRGGGEGGVVVEMSGGEGEEERRGQ